MKTECPFCNLLAKIIDDEKYYRENRPRRNQEAYKNKYTVALVSESYYEGNYTGETRYHGYELNYCPHCGAKIDESATDIYVGRN